MAHKISNIDKQQGLRQAWHGLTEIVKKIILDQCWLAEWDLIKSPLYSATDRGYEKTEYCELVCSDDKRIRVGKPVHRDTYGFISNKEFLQIVGDSISSIKGATVESVGSVCERGRIFVSVSVPEAKEFTAAGRVFSPFLNFFSSHDLSAPFGVQASTICIVCDNTFRMNLHSQGKEFKVRIPHTKNASKHLENIPEMIDIYCGTQARFAAILDNMANETVVHSDAERFFAGLLTVKDDAEASRFLRDQPEVETSTRRENQINRLFDLFVTGAGNKGENRADVFNAVTDYYSHESSGGDNVFRQVASSEFGAGQTAKSRAFNVLQDDQAFDQLVKVGDLVLAAN